MGGEKKRHFWDLILIFTILDIYFCPKMSDNSNPENRGSINLSKKVTCDHYALKSENFRKSL